MAKIVNYFVFFLVVICASGLLQQGTIEWRWYSAHSFIFSFYPIVMGNFTDATVNHAPRRGGGGGGGGGRGGGGGGGGGGRK